MSATESVAPANAGTKSIEGEWNRFWFSPADPTILGMIRILCGMISLYTIAVYSFSLADFMGEHGWYSLELRSDVVHNRAMAKGTINWANHGPLPEPSSEFETQYREHYRKRWGEDPPPPYPKDELSANYIEQFRVAMGYDPRNNGLRPPKDLAEQTYLELYARKNFFPPPAYPRDMPKDLEEKLTSKDEKVVSKLSYPEMFGPEAVEIEKYFDRHGADPRMIYARGTPVWSLWFHVVDPTAMTIVHGAFVLVTFLFMIGFCTRVTSFLSWFAALTYIHRNPAILFGVDTMMGVTLLYLAIGPSGAALSVDRWLYRRRFRAQFGAEPPPPEPSVTANFAIRLLQIHVCIIYFIAGISKLQGAAWWNGSAVWGTIANFEFAPMQNEFYMWVLRAIHRNQLVGEWFLFIAGFFTLAFEISYPYLIWRPATRWLLLAAAILLHGLIGLFMGLKTFALLMLVMNMAFLRTDEVLWLLSPFRGAPPNPAAATPVPERIGSPAVVGETQSA